MGVVRTGTGAWGIVVTVGVLFGGGGLGCGPLADDENTGTVRQEAVTSIVPTSDVCNAGLKGGECVSAPPIAFANAGRLVVDGERGALEYAHAIQIPYANLDLKATATVTLQPAYGGPRIIPNNPVDGSLHIHFDRVPFSLKDAELAVALVLQVYVDSDRFLGTNVCLDERDRRYDLNFLTREATAFRPRARRNTCDVIPKGWIAASEPRLDFVVKDCVPDPTSGSIVLCSGEARVPLRKEDLVISPTKGGVELTPGIGFAVKHAGQEGAAPEGVAKEEDVQGGIYLRTKLPTVLFGPPPVSHTFPLRIMSWNIRRFGSPGLRGPFATVSDHDIAKYLALHDIVAIQEGWDAEAVKLIHKVANEHRKIAGEKPFKLYGPVDFDPSLSKAIMQTVGTNALCAWSLVQPGSSKEGKCETTGTHGGLWVMSPFELAMSNRQVFSDCKGEDCFRAKGAQWVRLKLSEADIGVIACHGELGFNDGVSQPGTCPPLPSGDHFIDLYNVHLQAGGSELCANADAKSSLKETITIAAVSPEAAAGYFILKSLVQSDLNCSDQDTAVRKKQLQSLNAFVASTAAKDRPAVIVGDFNLDGKAFDGEYHTLVEQLQLGHTNPWPTDFTWDVDHADIVRDLAVDFSIAQPIGTFIDDTEGTEVSEPFAGDFDGKSRLDFFLIKPPVPPTHSNFEKQRWVVMKDGDALVWSSPWPGIAGPPFGPAPMRLSDHKPVIGAFRFTPLATPGKFHPTWKHEVDQRVVSANATGESDCWTCGEVDLFTKLWPEELKNGQVTSSFKQGSQCKNNDHVSYPHNSCTHNWGYTGSHDGGSAPAYHYLPAELWDRDSTSDNDLLTGNRGQVIFWNGVVALFRNSPREALSVFPIFDNEPVYHCTENQPTGMCFRTSPKELGPGLQF